MSVIALSSRLLFENNHAATTVKYKGHTGAVLRLALLMVQSDGVVTMTHYLAGSGGLCSACRHLGEDADD